MQLTRFSDFAFRALIYLAILAEDELTSIANVSAIYGVSRNHMIKVINRLSHAGFVKTVRGKHGGIKLAQPAQRIHLGDVIRALEPLELVNCNSPYCHIQSACRVRSILQQATQAFLEILDQYTLDDILDENSDLDYLFENMMEKHNQKVQN